MKKFYIKSIVFLFLIGLAIYFLGYAYSSTVYYQNILKEEGTYAWASVPEELDLVILGPSTGEHGIVYPPEEYRNYFFNFCLSSQTPQYDWQVLQEYRDHIQPNAIVIITLFYASPYWSDTPEAFESKQSRYYHVLSPEHIINVNYTADCNIKCERTTLCQMTRACSIAFIFFGKGGDI